MRERRTERPLVPLQPRPSTTRPFLRRCRFSALAAQCEPAFLFFFFLPLQYCLPSYPWGGGDAPREAARRPSRTAPSAAHRPLHAHPVPLSLAFRRRHPFCAPLTPAPPPSAFPARAPRCLSRLCSLRHPPRHPPRQCEPHPRPRALQCAVVPLGPRSILRPVSLAGASSERDRSGSSTILLLPDLSVALAALAAAVSFPYSYRPNSSYFAPSRTAQRRVGVHVYRFFFLIGQPEKRPKCFSSDRFACVRADEALSRPSPAAAPYVRCRAFCRGFNLCVHSRLHLPSSLPPLLPMSAFVRVVL